MTAHGAYMQVGRVHVCLTGLKGGVEMVGAIAGCSITALYQISYPDLLPQRLNTSTASIMRDMIDDSLQY